MSHNKIIFMGTPDFAVPTLQALIDDPAYEIVAVVTQPDRPRGRGKKLTPPPVKVTALAADLPIRQPKTLRSPEVVAELQALQPDVIIVAAFGQILKREVLDMPPHGCLNVHASLLPRWRGASPIAAAIRAGDAESGITIMQMDEGLDSGGMLSQRRVPIRADHTLGSLTDELAQVGADLLLDTLPQWLAGDLSATPQDESLVTLAPRLQKEEGEVDWSHPAVTIERLIRAFDPWPSAYTVGLRGRFKLLAAELATNVTPPNGAAAGLLFKQGKRVYVNTGEGVLRLITVQPASQKPMPAESMLNGQPELEGAVLGQQSTK